MKLLKLLVVIQSFLLASCLVDYEKYLKNLEEGLELINTKDENITFNGTEKGEKRR
jgi:hypothetical protein